MNRQRNGHGVRVGASGFRLSDNAPESGNVGRTPKRDGNVVLKFECASCGYWAGDVGFPIEQPESAEFLNDPYAEGKTVGWLEEDDGTLRNQMWARCIKCRGKSGRPREVLLQVVKITAALQELRRLHLEQQASPIVLWKF